MPRSRAEIVPKQENSRPAVRYPGGNQERFAMPMLQIDGTPIADIDGYTTGRLLTFATPAIGK